VKPFMFREVVRTHPWVGLWTLFVWVCAMGAFFSSMSFLSAQTPAEVNSPGQEVMPPEWPAGVNNHGTYYHWWTIGQRPGFFAVSIAVMVWGVVTAIRAAIRNAKLRHPASAPDRQQPCGPKTGRTPAVGR